MVSRLRALNPTTVTIMLVLLDLLFLGAAAVILIVTYLGIATTVANVRASGDTTEKAIVLGLFAAPWLPFVVLAAALALTIFLCQRFIVATQPQRAVPQSPVPSSVPMEAETALKRKIAEQTDEVYQATTERDDMRRERDSFKNQYDQVKSELAAVQTTSQAQIRTLAEELDRRPPKETLEKLLRELNAERNQRTALLSLAPVIRAYKRASDLATRLAAFADGIEQVEASGNVPDEVRRIHEIAAFTSDTFDRDYRAEMVTAATSIKSEFGVVVPELTDEQLARPVYGYGSVTDYVEGFKALAERLARIFVDRASKLDV